MDEYEITFSINSNFEKIQGITDFNINNHITVRYENNQWKALIKVNAENLNEAIKNAWECLNTHLVFINLLFPRGLTNPPIYFVAGSVINIISKSNNEIKIYVFDSFNLSDNISIINNNTKVDEFFKKFSKIGNLISTDKNLKNLIDEINIPIYFYNRALIEDDFTYKYIDFMISIESMLSERSETTEKVSRRLAVLVSTDFKDMQTTFEEFKDLYDIRSKILHDGKTSQLTTETIQKIQEYNRIALRNYLLLILSGYNKKKIKENLDDFFKSEKIKELSEKIQNKIYSLFD